MLWLESFCSVGIADISIVIIRLLQHMVISCLLTTPILDHSNVDVLQQLYSFVREIVTCECPTKLNS